MDLVKQRSLGQRAKAARRRFPSLALSVAGVIVLAVAASLVTIAILSRTLVTGPAPGDLGSDEWRLFRAGERSQSVASDPWLDPAMIQFRADERNETPAP